VEVFFIFQYLNSQDDFIKLKKYIFPFLSGAVILVFKFYMPEFQILNSIFVKIYSEIKKWLRPILGLGVNIVIDDIRYFIRNTKKCFDLIFMMCIMDLTVIVVFKEIIVQ